MRRAAMALVLVALAACSPKTVVVGEDADGTTVSIEPGQELRVELPENASVGWTWDLTTEPDADVLRFVDDDYEADSPEATGSGGIRRYRFKGTGPGETQIVLSRDFRGEGVDRTVRLTVQVAFAE